MPKSLVISRHFPPLGSVGSSIRLVKIIKYLTQANWNFIVLTQDPARSVTHEEELSKFMEDEIPLGTQVIRIPAPFSDVVSQKNNENETDYHINKMKSLIKSLLDKVMPQSSLWWGVRVLMQGRKVIIQENVDIIYTPSPVFMNAFIGYLIALFFHKPLFLDLKDDWVGSAIYNNKKIIGKLVDRLFESVIIHNAEKVIIVTEHSYNTYKQRYPKLALINKFELIPNGCDLDEYSSLRGRAHEIDRTRFRIISAAWGYQKDYRDITPFFLGLSKFLKRFPEAWEKIEVVLLGNSLSTEYDELLDQTGIRKITKLVGSLHRELMIETLWTADLFLLVQPKNNVTAISGTIYEYWAIGHAPILIISEQGASSEIIDRYNLGKSFCFKDHQGIVDYLQAVYYAKMNGNPLIIKRDGIENFDRKILANRMGHLWQVSLSKVT